LLILLHYRGNKKAVTQHSFSVLWYDVQGTPILCNQSPWLGCCNENANTTRLWCHNILQYRVTVDEPCPLFTMRNNDPTKLYAEIYDKKATTIKVLCTTFTVSTFSTKMHLEKCQRSQHIICI
jgi:hypothetical protein